MESPANPVRFTIFGECEPDNSDNQNQYLGYLSSNSHFAKGSPVTPVMLTNTPDTVYGPIRIAADDTTLLYDECCNASSQDVIAMNVKTLVTTQLTHDGDDSDPAPVQPTWLAPTACPSLEMMGVRGSRNNSSDLLPYDEVTASTDDFVSDRVDGLKFNSVNYQAIPVDIKQQAFYAANYLRSVADGKSVLQAMLTSFIASCPHTYVMLVGYSQGAQVANDIYHFLPAGDQSHILMALFGNPEFTSLQNAVDFGSYTPGLYGVFTEALEDWFIPKEFVPNVHSYCLAGDTVCNFPGNLVACGAKLKSCPHYHYIDAYTGDAAKWLVSRWLAAPKL